MPQSVIDHLNAKAQGQPTYPVFTDCHGNAIKDIAVDVGHIETVEPDVELPGVHLPEVGESAKTPGVYTDLESKLPELNVDVGIDFDNPAPQELPLVEVKPIQANDVVCVCVCSGPSVMRGVTVKHALTCTSSPPNDIPIHTLEPSSTTALDPLGGLLERFPTDSCISDVGLHASCCWVTPQPGHLSLQVSQH